MFLECEYWIAGILAFLALILVLLAYYGVLSPVRLQRAATAFTPSKFLYYNSQQNYSKCGDEWNKVGTQMAKHFQLSNMAGVYYDNPSILIDKNQSRITFGILVNRGEENKIEAFQNEFPNYELTTLRTVDSVISSYPYRSPISFLFAIQKIYPNLKGFIVEKNIEIKAIMEIYYLKFQKRIDYVAVYGNGSDNYVLTPYPAPQTKKQQ